MKPEDLKSTFSKKARQILIKDRIWYVPNHSIAGSTFTFPGWNHPDLFGNFNPIKVEYCSGNGLWIAEMAKKNPNINWLAVEIKFVRARKIWSKIKNMNLSNLLVINGEGRNATAQFFPANSVDEIFINFPDPWPKARHAKHRIINNYFVSEMARILKIKGLLTFVTDDPDYSQWSIEHINADSNFKSCFQNPHYKTEWDSYGDSYFDSLWREKGKSIRYHQFIKDLHTL